MKKSLKIMVVLTLIVSMLAINASAMSVDWSSETVGAVGGGAGAAQVQQITFDPVDVSAYDHVHVWVYIDDPALISTTAGNPQFELSSSGKCDNSEMNWDLKGYNWKAGWNELWLAFSDANYSDGSTGKVDVKAINFCRMYLFTESDAQVTIKIDGIEFSTGKIVDGSLKVDLTSGSGTTAFGPEAYIKADLKAGAVAVIFQKNFENKMDISKFAENGYIKMAIWASADVAFNDAQFEFTSSGTCDQAEINFNLNTKALKAGWNTVYFAVKDAGKTPGTSGNADLTAINFSRLYALAKNDATIKIASVDFGTAKEFGILGDFTALDAAIKNAENKVTLDTARNITYSYATKSVYDTALSAAKNLSRELTKDDQAKIDAAAKALTDATSALKAGVSPWMYFVVFDNAGNTNLPMLPIIDNLTTETLPATTTNPYNFN